MSKLLILMRHAEAAVARSGQSDFDRHLTSNGRAQAQQMGHILKEKAVQPDYILASTAVRTMETATLLAKSWSLSAGSVEGISGLYNAPADILKAAIAASAIPDNINTLLLVAHNPGISQLALECVPEPVFSHLPPCGTVLLEAGITHWDIFSPDKCILRFFELPER